VKQALRCGCPPSRIVYDSPCKTTEELRFALEAGVMVNANSLQEVERIAAVLDGFSRERYRSASVIGLRVNPMVGAGAIDALSTATATSKFGVPCRYADQVEGEALPEGRIDLREEIIAAYLKYPFLRAIMCHVGSQGMPLESMVQGAATILNLANEIDARCRHLRREGGEKGAGRITHVDIGGGLSANYDSDQVIPTFAEYAKLLAAHCGAQFRAAPHRTLVTEFGKALAAKCGAIATRVEECREFTALAPLSTAPEKLVLATVHAGADLLLRTCYCPEKFPHRLVLLDAHKQPLNTTTPDNAGGDAQADAWTLTPSTARAPAKVTVAGPLCFSGDILGKSLSLPEPRAGDICLVMDAGANTLSLFSRHCSRRSPAVLAFRRISLRAPKMGELRLSDNSSHSSSDAASKASYERFAVACIRPAESEADVLRFWG
jgi:diaminopimelate decarboxylase